MPRVPSPEAVVPLCRCSGVTADPRRNIRCGSIQVDGLTIAGE
jgi:hypothetical protein